jgi:hypothetical protein
MSIEQNLAYTVVQVLHNFGAVAAVGGSLAGSVSTSADLRKRLAWIALGGWVTQAASGAGLGTVSFFFSHQFPDIAGAAVVALSTKILCAVAGFSLLVAYLRWGANWKEDARNMTWFSTSVLSVIALSAAAVLRWFS